MDAKDEKARRAVELAAWAHAQDDTTLRAEISACNQAAENAAGMPARRDAALAARKVLRMEVARRADERMAKIGRVVENDPTPAADEDVRVRRASFHVVTGDEAFVMEALSGAMGDTAKLAAQTAVGDGITRDYLEDSARIAAGLYVLLQVAEVIDAAGTP